MRIFIDDQPIPEHVRLRADSLANAITTVIESADGRMIVEATADGQPVPPEHLETPPDTAPYAQELRFRTADPRLLVRETLFDASDALREIRHVQKHSADLIQTGDKAAALQELTRVVQIWDQVNRAWELSRSVEMLDLADLASVSIAAGCDVELATSRLNDTLRELQRLLLALDWSGLADLLHDEMDEQAERWAEIMSALAGTVAGT